VLDTALMNPPAPSSSASSTSPLADLILARLLPAKKSLAPKQLRDDLAPLFRHTLTSDHLHETLESLRAAGLVTPKGQLPTAEGQSRALAYLGTTALPPKANWSTIKTKFLVPKALGLSPSADGKLFGDAKKLAPFLLKRQLGLPVGTANSLNAVFEAIACRELGYPNIATFKELLPHLLGKANGSDEPLRMEKPENVARVLLDAPRPGMEGLRAIALAGLVNAETEAEPSVVTPESEPLEQKEYDLKEFADTVLALARQSPTGRWGDNKVFINHVWRQMQEEPQFPPLSLSAFKEKLIAANRENLLTLSRADLVQVMNADDVQESETNYLNTVFHFILLEK
jgi:hypothetical protein